MTGFVLKIIAALAMLIDHAAIMLFDDLIWMRAIGRLAFPIFAYLISEGFIYTRDRFAYFKRLCLLGLLCQLAYALEGESFYMGVLLVFSYSIILCELVDRARKDEAGRWKWLGLFAAAVTAYFVFAHFFTVDYGPFGVLLPVLPTLFRDKGRKFAAFSLGVAAVYLWSAIELKFGGEVCAFAALPLIWFYNGKPGKRRYKSFFYVFYPLHLALLYLVGVMMGKYSLPFNLS